MMEPKVSLSLSLKDVNAILQALGQMPFIQVVELIQTVKTQAENQLSAPKTDSIDSLE